MFEYEFKPEGGCTLIFKYDGETRHVDFPSKTQDDKLILFIKKHNDSQPMTNLTSIHIPEGIIELGDECFKNAGLKYINFPKSLKKIGTACFSGCSELEGDLIIPFTIQHIAPYAFQNCGSINGYICYPSDACILIGSKQIETQFLGVENGLFMKRVDDVSDDEKFGVICRRYVMMCIKD